MTTPTTPAFVTDPCSYYSTCKDALASGAVSRDDLEAVANVTLSQRIIETRMALSNPATFAGIHHDVAQTLRLELRADLARDIDNLDQLTLLLSEQQQGKRCPQCGGDGTIWLADPSGNPELEREYTCPTCWGDKALDAQRVLALRQCFTLPLTDETNEPLPF